MLGLSLAPLLVLPALAGPAPATDPALPDATTHLGLGASLSGSSGAVFFSTGDSWTTVNYGGGGSVRLRLPRGLTIAPTLAMASTSKHTWQEEGNADRYVGTEVDAGLTLRPVLARRGRVELSAIAGLGYQAWRVTVEEDLEEQDSVPTDQTTGSGGTSHVDVPAEQTPDQRSRYHGGKLKLGMGLTRWFDPTLSLSADLTLGGGVGALESDELEASPAAAHGLGLAVELDPAVSLSLHLWL
ncbi:hypothetical protein L6R53_11430 [Myxococcota bacterium]|nr:hypothetical protein [Myxococcota bacterium]